MLFAVVVSFAGMCAALTLAWCYQWRSHNAGMVDPVWAAALGSVAIAAAGLGTGHAINRAFVGVAGGVWGLRLAMHLWRRNYGHPEDARYRQFREQWGEHAGRNMFWFFQLQGVIAMLLAAASCRHSTPTRRRRGRWPSPHSSGWPPSRARRRPTVNCDASPPSPATVAKSARSAGGGTRGIPITSSSACTGVPTR